MCIYNVHEIWKVREPEAGWDSGESIVWEVGLSPWPSGKGRHHRGAGFMDSRRRADEGACGRNRGRNLG